VILDASGDTKATVSDPALVSGHSITIIQAGSGSGPQAWVTDKGSCTIRLYGPDGSIGATLGPTVPETASGSSITFGEVRRHFSLRTSDPQLLMSRDRSQTSLTMRASAITILPTATAAVIIIGSLC
jgi:hypothetical protein